MMPFLRFHDVSYHYPHQDYDAVQSLSFVVHQGEFLGILGADDSGKTTIARLANGLLLPSKGHILQVNSHEGPKNSAFALTLSSSSTQDLLYQFRRKIGVIFSDPENQIVGTTVEEDVAFGPGNLQLSSQEIRVRVDRYLKQVGLLQYAKRAPHELSGGEQQKLCIASVLAMEPECLVLDEPVTFLDGKSRNELQELFYTINAAGKTLIYLTSNPEELFNTHRILVLHKGTILTECSIQMLWNTPAILEQADIYPPDMMIFCNALRQRGYPIEQNSLTPEAIVSDICQ